MAITAHEPVRIGQHRQLFLDDYLIAASEKVTRRVCPVTKHPANPVIHPQEPWEPEGYITYGTVLFDEEAQVYKAWCHGVGNAPEAPGVPPVRGGGVYHFISEDGITWQRPALDVVSINGQPSHLTPVWHEEWPLDAPPFFEIFGVSKDERETDPSRRYKLGFLYFERNYQGPHQCPLHPGQRRGMGVAFSADGVHWQTLKEPVTMATSDGATHWFRDPVSGRFVMYGRTKHFSPEFRARYEADPAFAHNAGRAVRRSESEDFLHWTPEYGEFVLAADVLDGPGDDIYGMNVFPYEGIYIGLVQVFHHYVDRAWLDVQLAVSRDSIHFERLSDRAPFIPVGEVGAWDRFNNSLATNPPHRVGDELRFYYGGRNYVHTGVCKGPDNGKDAGLSYMAGVGVGSIAVDRFCAMEASFDTGTLRTRPILIEGRQLRVNLGARFGRVHVALLHPDGTPIDGAGAMLQEVDGLDVPVAIDLSGLIGQAVVLEFRISNAQLYAFRVE